MMYKCNSDRYKKEFGFTKGKLYLRVKDDIYRGYNEDKKHPCILNNEGKSHVMMLNSPLFNIFEPIKHVLNNYYRLKYMFV